MSARDRHDDSSIISVSPASWLKICFGAGVSPLFPDLTLCVGDKWSMPAHRAVLASAVPYFRQALTTERWAKSAIESGVVKFSEKEMSPESLRAVVGVSYGETIDLTPANVCGIHGTANFLGLEVEIAGKCVKYMIRHLKPETLIGFWLYAQQEFPGSNDLLMECEKVMKCEFAAMTSQSEFLNLKWDKLVSVCAVEKLRPDVSEDLFLDGYLKWLNFDWASRCSQVSAVMKSINWAYVDFAVINEFESIEEIRSRVYYTEVEKFAELELTQKLLQCTKRRRMDDDVLQNSGVGLVNFVEKTTTVHHMSAHRKREGRQEYRQSIYKLSGGTWCVQLEQSRCLKADKTLFYAAKLPWYTWRDKLIFLAQSQTGKLTLWLPTLQNPECADWELPINNIDHKDFTAALSSTEKRLCILELTSDLQALSLLVYSLEYVVSASRMKLGPSRVPLLFYRHLEGLFCEFRVKGCTIGAVESYFVLLGGIQWSAMENDEAAKVYNRKFWMLDLSTFIPKEGPRLPYEAETPTVCSSGDYLFVTGGSRRDTTLSDAFCHKLGTQFWTRLPPMTARREGHSLVVCRDRLVAFGGTSQGCPVNFGEELNLRRLDEGWTDVEAFKNVKAGFVSAL